MTENPVCWTGSGPDPAQTHSIRTEQAYVDWIRRFVLHHNKRHPRDMGRRRSTRL